MDPKRILIVYYSRTGITREVARALRDELGCEIERIADRGHRGGVLGYLRSAFDATFGRSAALRPMNTDEQIHTTVADGVVTLEGRVPYLSHHDDSENVARSLRGVREVKNLLHAAG